MQLYSISIRRPVLSIVQSVVLVILGLLGLKFLGVREYPSIDPPIITVSTSYSGANPDIIESQITEPLEESINGIEGIKSITSVSREGRSTVTVEFDLDADLDASANDVRDRVSRAMSNLPKDVDPPVVAKADADAFPILLMTAYSEKRNILELSDFANRILKERLQTIPGVSSVQIWGEKRFAIRLWFDPAKMAAFKINATQINSALSAENLELPSGRLEGKSTELIIRTKGLLRSADDFNELIIKAESNRIIRLKDIGYAELGPENERTAFRKNSVPMVGIVIIPQPGSNHIKIAEEFYDRVERLKKDIPSDISVAMAYDLTKFIRNSIAEVEQSLLFAFILVILIIFLFLREWRSTLIPILAIPVSLVFSFFIMYLLGFSINVLTLLGLVLAIGIVVDDAIIVLENIYSKIESGIPAMEAGESGTKEIFFAVISTTITLVSVFLPLLFLQGITGRLFREFGIVIAAAVTISAFVALTLTPMLSVKFMRKAHGHSKFYQWTEPFFSSIISNYERLLANVMKRRWIVVAIIIVMAGMIFIFGSNLKSELAPIEDRSAIRITFTGLEGTSFESMDAAMYRASDSLMKFVPEIDGLIAVTGGGGGGGAANSGFFRMMLTDPENRRRAQQEIFEDLSKKLRGFSNVRLALTQEQTIGTRSRGLPIQFVIQSGDIEKLRAVLPEFLRRVNENPVLQMADVNLKFNKPELDIEINRSKARELQVSTGDIARTLQLLFSGMRYGYYIWEGKQYQIIGQVQRRDRYTPEALKDLYIANAAGEMINLDNVITMNESSSPPQLYRFNRYVSATVSAGLAPGKTMGEGLDEMEKIRKAVLDESFTTAYDGPSRDYKESSSSLLFIFLLALVFIYLILAAQFESFRSPFIIMFTVPLALAGALFTLWIFNQTINIFSQIGLILLIGLVTKNGILIVEFANQRRVAGSSKIDAAISASKQRLRPILMTSLATILGILPIALSIGAGAESRKSMGIAVVGGMLLSTLLTLIVIPVLYSFVMKKDK